MHKRLLIAGTHSGCGKTTVTLALLSALKARDLPLCAFKCGPDYIDPLFHREALGLPSRNLDPFFFSGDQLRGALARQPDKLCLVEGVMGYYDGVGPQGDYSSYEVARQTQTPVVLVVNAKGMYASAGALLQGFRGYKADSGIRGVIFNGVSASLYPGLARIAREAGLRPLGCLPREEGLSIASRHLGLITAGEVDDLKEKLQKLGELAGQGIDLEGVIELAAEAAALKPLPSSLSPFPAPVRLAVARDEAFCFLYRENLETLEALGCELCFFSPLRDEALPDNIGGLYLPGGYPELHAQALSQNGAMLKGIREAVLCGLPTLAECGGFLYLHEQLDGFEMAGVIPARAFRTDRLRRFGYVTLRAGEDNLLCRAGDSIRAHEFHYYESESPGGCFTAVKPDGRTWDCVHASHTLWAGFPHLYFPANESFAIEFVRKAANYAQRHFGSDQTGQQGGGGGLHRAL